METFNNFDNAFNRFNELRKVNMVCRIEKLNGKWTVTYKFN